MVRVDLRGMWARIVMGLRSSVGWSFGVRMFYGFIGWDEVRLEDDGLVLFGLEVLFKCLECMIGGGGANDGHVGLVEVNSASVAPIVPSEDDACGKGFAICTVGGILCWLEDLCQMLG